MKTALITGASNGIGLESANVYARHGYDVLLVARSEDKLRTQSLRLASTYGVSARFLTADLASMDEVRKVIAWTDGLGAAVDVLVNNAGFGDFGYALGTSWAKEDAMIDLNVKALTLLSKEYAIRMKRAGGGRICNLASTAAFQPVPLMAVYAATKAYVLSFSEAFAEELDGTGVTVTALCPGPTRTGFAAAADAERTPLFRWDLPSALEVAEYGYEATMAGRVVAIHGVKNALTAMLPRFLPRSMIRKAVHSDQSRGLDGR